MLPPLRHLVAYGSANKYIPVKNCKASAATAKRPVDIEYLFSAMATMVMITAAVGHRRPAVRLSNPFFPVHATSFENESKRE